MRARRHGTGVQSDVGAASAHAARMHPPILRGFLARTKDAHAQPQPAGGSQGGKSSIPSLFVVDAHLDARGLDSDHHRVGQLIGNRQGDGASCEDTRRHHARDIRQGAAPLCSDEDRGRAVAQDVTLARQARDVTVDPVVACPGGGIGDDGAMQLRQLRLSNVLARRVVQGEHVGRQTRALPRIGLSRELIVGRFDIAQAQQVGGTARLRRRTDGGTFPPAEGLAAHDGPRDATVDIEIARLDTIQPLS